jgi:hypothetical protein
VTAIAHPARHNIYYMLSQRVRDAKSILKELAEYGLPVPDDYEDVEQLTIDILRARQAMHFPIQFEPRAKTPNAQTLAFLKRWKILDMWRKSPFVGAATSILIEPQVRHELELLLLGPLTASAISKRLVERFDLPMFAMNPGVVRAYGHYYWNVHAMNPGQWRKFLHACYPDRALEYIAVLKAPRSEAGAALSIAIADKDPQQLGILHRYEAASTLAFGMMMHHALAEDGLATKHTYAAFTALNMMRMADEELEKHRGGSSDLISEMQKLRTIYDQTEPLKITQATFIQRPVLQVESETEVIEAEGTSDD